MLNPMKLLKKHENVPLKFYNRLDTIALFSTLPPPSAPSPTTASHPPPYTLQSEAFASRYASSCEAGLLTLVARSVVCVCRLRTRHIEGGWKPSEFYPLIKSLAVVLVDQHTLLLSTIIRPAE